MLNQYVNEANPEAHYKTTGPEIWRQTEGKVTHFVAGLGTCGTITGTGRFLKAQKSPVKILGVHPEEGHDIPGVRSIRQLQQTQLFVPDEYDGLVEVTNQEAFDLCLRLNREESIIAGPSSAMALSGAFELVPDEPGNIAVVMFPDSAFQIRIFGREVSTGSRSGEAQECRTEKRVARQDGRERSRQPRSDDRCRCCSRTVAGWQVVCHRCTSERGIPGGAYPGCPQRAALGAWRRSLSASPRSRDSDSQRLPARQRLAIRCSVPEVSWLSRRTKHYRRDSRMARQGLQDRL